jgi:hypothetical protein
MSIFAAMRRLAKLLLAPLMSLAFLGLASGEAQALPAFAAQTGQPCQSCHVGGLGPQLTPYGRNFKLDGYTQRTTPFNIPLAVMAQVSYLDTQKSQNPPVPTFAPNNNFAVDQISLFLAGGWGDHVGAFIQTTYDGVARAFHWDQTDIRLTQAADVAGHHVVVGLDLNNSPTVQDAWNTLPSWGYPYTLSELAPSQGTSPLLNGAFAQTTLGATAYTWIDNHFYVEGGGYESPSAGTLTRLGADPTNPGSIAGIAPYGRVAVQERVLGGTMEGGAYIMDSRIHPGLNTQIGVTDHYTDSGVDFSYFKTLKSSDVITLNARYLHEQQDLAATCLIDAVLSGCNNNTLDDYRLDAAYYWRNSLGGTVQVFNTTGNANPVIYANNRTFAPNTTGMMFQVDATPFGGGAQPQRRVNVRVGLQYILYTRFNGAANNFDGAGTSGSNNNSLRIFSWFMF